YLYNTIEAINGRTVHTYHTEGAGGGHAPDFMRIAGEPNVLPSSTSPTKPFTINSVDEAFDMTIVTHHLSASNPEDVAFAHSRIRPETMAAEDLFQDWGVLSMYSSDSQAMGRCGEVSTRCWQTAHKMKAMFGKLPEDSEENDNFRVLRYLAKLTINPAITNGVSDYLGSLETGKMADLALWDTGFFGVKPKMVFKGGFIAFAMMGDPNASIPIVEPIYWRPMFGGYGKAQTKLSTIFTSNVAYNLNIKEKYGLERSVLPVSKTRHLGKDQMVRNSTLGKIQIDPETYRTSFNGQLAECEPATELPMTQLYYLA
ncbi:MAG: urease subunit alpha, partial [Rhabdochlamydiaceae bacterium]